VELVMLSWNVLLVEAGNPVEASRVASVTVTIGE
jgi:hypothetical protein